MTQLNKMTTLGTIFACKQFLPSYLTALHACASEGDVERNQSEMPQWKCLSSNIIRKMLTAISNFSKILLAFHSQAKFFWKKKSFILNIESVKVKLYLLWVVW